jgi:hypothetical protein
VSVRFRSGLLSMTPYLTAARPAPRRPHDRSLQKPELRRSPRHRRRFCRAHVPTAAAKDRHLGPLSPPCPNKSRARYGPI